MNIALIGYGKMGQQIDRMINESGKHSVVHIAYKDRDDELSVEHLKDVDVAIDFSHGSLMDRHIDIYCQAKVNAVIGTTNWDSHDQELIKKIEASGIGVVVGSNFSAGVQVFLQVLRTASRQLSRIGGYDVFGYEVHHAMKADSPSGTARTIVETILSETHSKSTVVFDRVDGQIQGDQLHFASIRGGQNSGAHEVTFDSEADTITLRHSAHNRKGFAAGAIAAVDFAAKHPGFTRYEDLFKEGGYYGI